MIPSNEEFEQVLQEVGWTAKWEARARQQERQQMLELLDSGVTVEELRQRLTEALGQKA